MIIELCRKYRNLGNKISKYPIAQYSIASYYFRDRQKNICMLIIKHTQTHIHSMYVYINARLDEKHANTIKGDNKMVTRDISIT